MFRVKFFYNGEAFPALAGSFVCSSLFERYEQADQNLRQVMNGLAGEEGLRKVMEGLRGGENGFITGAQIETLISDEIGWCLATEPDYYEENYCTACDVYATETDCWCGAMKGSKQIPSHC